MPLSGPLWVPRFPASTRIEDLAEPFRGNVRRFLAALRQAHASVAVADTLRRSERAYLMHFAFAIARESLDPRAVPPKPGVDIQWLHRDAHGQPDVAASRAAAEQMVRGYGIVFKPVLGSRHTAGTAIDMTITWQNNLSIAGPDGTIVTISSAPRDGAGNTDLHRVGRSYNVIKLASDPPHWSADGH